MDGTPKLIFRARDERHAATWMKTGNGRRLVFVNDLEGVFTTRPATIPEQAEWRAHSVKMQAQAEASGDTLFRHGLDPDWYMLLPGEVK